MLLQTAIVGLLVLAFLAVFIGRLERGAKASAWARIASARKQNAEKEQRLIEAYALLRADTCSNCPVQRYLDAQYGDQ